uniref:Ribosomal protein S7 n=1 Tax=Analipus japonicus TaxID=31333 RepID=A0A8F0K101_9PHAE|nr:ribosomal protein S7 [Analipus japonicus]
MLAKSLEFKTKRSFDVTLKESFKFLGIDKDPLVRKMVSLLMRDGKRPKAEKVLYKAFESIDEDFPGRSLHIFYYGLFEARRDIGIRLKPKPKKRRNVTIYNSYVPYRISPICGLHLGMRALLKASKERSSSLPFYVNLSQELVEASLGKGDVVAKRYRLNILAESNKRKVHLGVRHTFPLIFEF